VTDTPQLHHQSTTPRRRLNRRNYDG